MKIYFIITIAFAFILCSCSGSYELTQFGDESTISLKEGDDINGEFLFVTDSSFFITGSGTNEIYELGFKKCNDVMIKGYSNREWILPVILLEGVTTAAFTIEVAANTNAFPWFLVAIPALSYFLFEMGTKEDPGINKGEVNKYTAEKLNKYARFPRGLSTDQFLLISKNKTVKHIF